MARRRSNAFRPSKHLGYPEDVRARLSEVVNHKLMPNLTVISEVFSENEEVIEVLRLLCKRWYEKKQHLSLNDVYGVCEDIVPALRAMCDVLEDAIPDKAAGQTLALLDTVSAKDR